MVGKRANLFKAKWPYETRFDSAAGLVVGKPRALERRHRRQRARGQPLAQARATRPCASSTTSTAASRRACARGPSRRSRRSACSATSTSTSPAAPPTEPQIPIGGDIKAAPGAGIEKLLEGSGDLLDGPLGDRPLAQEHPRPHGEGRGIPRRDHVEEPGERAARQQLQRDAGVLELDPQEGRQGPRPRRPAPDRREVRQGDRRVAAGRHPLRRVALREDRRGHRRPATARIPALLTDPEGKKKVFTLLDNLSIAAASLAKVTEQLEKGDGTLPLLLRDEKFGTEFTRNLLEFSQRLELDRPQARRRRGNRGQAHQRSVALRRRQPPRRRRGRVDAAPLARSRTGRRRGSRRSTTMTCAGTAAAASANVARRRRRPRSPDDASRGLGAPSGARPDGARAA